jgi:hypothetical protein
MAKYVFSKTQDLDWERKALITGTGTNRQRENNYFNTLKFIQIMEDSRTGMDYRYSTTERTNIDFGRKRHYF